MNEDKETLYCLDNVEYKGAVGTGEWKTEHFHIRETYEKISSALTFFKRTYLNISGKTLDFVPCAERKFRHSLRRFLIPCVSYNGNRWGNGMEPKGLEYEGKKWIFSADRTGVPGCSIVESEGAFCTALFAADDEVSKDCSCSLYEVKGEGYTHRLYFSHIEFPICYAEKFRYSEAIRESRRLKACLLYTSISKTLTL